MVDLIPDDYKGIRCSKCGVVYWFVSGLIHKVNGVWICSNCYPVAKDYCVCHYGKAYKKE